MTKHNFHTPHYEVSVDTEALYGYFEHNTRGENSAGGLWFGRDGDGGKIHLIDYDGVFELPKAVIDSLRIHGFVVDGDFE